MKSGQKGLKLNPNGHKFKSLLRKGMNGMNDLSGEMMITTKRHLAAFLKMAIIGGT